MATNSFLYKIGLANSPLCTFCEQKSESLEQAYSDDFPLPHGVPQGSCLGPLLFTMYASKLFEVVKNHLLNIHAYADDTQIYLSFKPKSTAGEQDAITALQDCISDIRSDDCR